MSDIRLIGFDVDGTLVQHDENVVVWQIFHNHYMVDPQVGVERYRQFKAGQLSFDRWVALDVQSWIDAHAKKEEMVKIIRENLTLTQDAEWTLCELKRRGYIIGLISGTLDLVTDELLKDVPFDFAFMNHLQFDENGYLCGWQASRFDAPGKAITLEEMAKKRGLTLENCAFVGDHINDLGALKAAALGIGYMPKDPSVNATAKAVIPGGSFKQLLDFFPDLTK